MGEGIFKVRFAEADDLLEVMQLSYGLTYSAHKQDDSIDINWKLHEYIQEVFDRKNLIVCLCGNEIVGYAAIEIVVEEYRDKIIFDVAEIFVKKEMRGKNAGHQILDFIYAYAQGSMGIKKWIKNRDGKDKICGAVLAVKVSAKNARAIEFYKREGFEDYDIILEKTVS